MASVIMLGACRFGFLVGMADVPGGVVGDRYSGAVAQLGERLHGMQEVVGSTPIGSILWVGFLFYAK